MFKRRRIVDGQFSLCFVVPINCMVFLCLKRPKINEKDAGYGLPI